MALTGVGCALLPDFLVGADIAVDRLIALLPVYTPRGAFGNVFALYLPSRQGNPEVRAFIDWMLERLAAPLRTDPP